MSSLRCIYTGCGKHSITNPGLMLMSFPKERSLQLLWIKNAGVPQLKELTSEQLRHYRICLEHFQSADLGDPDKKYYHAIPVHYQKPEPNIIPLEKITENESSSPIDLPIDDNPNKYTVDICLDTAYPDIHPSSFEMEIPSEFLEPENPTPKYRHVINQVMWLQKRVNRPRRPQMGIVKCQDSTKYIQDMRAPQMVKECPRCPKQEERLARMKRSLELKYAEIEDLKKTLLEAKMEAKWAKIAVNL